MFTYDWWIARRWAGSRAWSVSLTAHYRQCNGRSASRRTAAYMLAQGVATYFCCTVLRLILGYAKYIAR